MRGNKKNDQTYAGHAGFLFQRVFTFKFSELSPI